MDKPRLLQQAALVRARAEAAHLEIVISRELIAEQENEGVLWLMPSCGSAPGK
jgi:hypothetical protein